MLLSARIAELAVPFHSHDARRLLLAFGISEIGDGVAEIVVPLAIYAATESVGLLAISFIGRILLGTVAGILGGFLADRFERPAVLRGSYACRAALVLLLVLLYDHTVAVFVLGTVIGASGALDNPSAEASLRQLLADTPKAIATVRGLTESLSGMVGPALGALLIAVTDARVALIVDLATFVISFLILARLRMGKIQPTGLGLEEEEKAQRGYGEVVKIVRASALLRMAFMSSLLSGVAVACVLLLAIPYLAELGAPQSSYGWTLAIYSVGGMVGVAMGGLLSLGRPIAWYLTRCQGFYGAICVASVVVPLWWVLPVAWCLWGVAYGPEQVLSDAAIVKQVPGDVLGRLYALWGIVARCSAAIGFAISGFLDASAARSGILVVGGLYLTVGPLAVWLCSSRGGSDIPGHPGAL